MVLAFSFCRRYDAYICNMEEAMILQAYAKINWSLDITGVRDDGYHYMDMLMQPVSIADEITLTPSPDLRITTGGRPRSRADESNLAYRAAQALKNATGYSGGAAIHVQKQIPMGAGMGGGSTDAAAVLSGLNRMWNINLHHEDLEKIGLTLGADVPFFIRGGLTRTRGIGELLESHDCQHNYWLVVIQPCPGLSTAQVFSLWHDTGGFRRPETDQALRALLSGNLTSFCGYIDNVLQPVSESLRPEIIHACTALKDEGALTAKMTGSGSAVFGVFRSPLSAENAYSRLSSSYRTVFLCHTQHDSLRVLQD